MLPKRLLEIFRANKVLFLLGAAGLCLLLFSGWGGAQESHTDTSPVAAAEEYRTALQTELAALCRRVRGVGEAQVFVSLASTEIAIYEKNQSGE